MSPPCVCSPLEVDGNPYVQWIGSIFSDCVYSSAEITAFLLGLANIALWMVSQFPQIWENFRRKEAEALSVGLLFAWTFGDLFNLIGCILTQQLPTQTYTAVYFCTMDVVLCGQWLYYKYAPKGRRTKSPAYMYALPLVMIGLGSASMSMFGAGSGAAYTGGAAGATGRVLLAAEEDLCNPAPVLSNAASISGDIISWLSGMCYFFSRMPQIVANYRRKSVDGLAMSMFICAAAANTCYGLSIILRVPTVDAHFFGATLPFIIGSIGTLVFDFTILIQAHLYKGSGYEKILNNKV